jgi:hypothetical protein
VLRNGRPLARPADDTFVYYGKYRFTLVKDGYETLHVDQEVRPPWWQYPPIDFVVENLIPYTFRDIRRFNYSMQPAEVLAQRRGARPRCGTALSRDRAIRRLRRNRDLCRLRLGAASGKSSLALHLKRADEVDEVHLPVRFPPPVAFALHDQHLLGQLHHAEIDSRRGSRRS